MRVCIFFLREISGIIYSLVARTISCTSLILWIVECARPENQGNRHATEEVKTGDYIYMYKLSFWLSKGKAHPCTGTEALYRPYGP